MKKKGRAIARPSPPLDPPLVAFVKNANKRKTKILDLIYSDVCGPMRIKTHGDASYFVTFIYDACAKAWMYVLKSKDQIFEVFKDFHANFEKKTRKFLKCIHMDNGGEYTSKMFKEYCSKHDIRHQKTVSYTPQYNGVAERMNHTIVERVMSMLSLTDLPNYFVEKRCGPLAT